MLLLLRSSAAEIITGTLAATEAQDTAALAGAAAFVGTLAGTETQDTATAAGTVSDPSITGTLAGTDTQDTASIAGALLFTGEFAATEPTQDNASLSGAVASVGTLAASEGQDAASATGALAFAGALSADEGQDTAAFAGELVGATAEATQFIGGDPTQPVSPWRDRDATARESTQNRRGISRDPTGDGVDPNAFGNDRAARDERMAAVLGQLTGQLTAEPAALQADNDNEDEIIALLILGDFI